MTEASAPIDLSQLRRTCRACGLLELCLPAGIDQAELERLDSSVRDKRTLEAGGMLFRQGDPFHALYVVRSGTLKTVVQDADGAQQVLGFHLPGEIVGVDAIAHDMHQSSAEALERSSICELPYTRLQELTAQIPGLQRQLLRIVSREMVAEQAHLVMMGRQQAQERLAIFLRSLSERYGRLARDTTHLILPMSRYDIANHLGVVVETVSRLFTRMEDLGVLRVSRKVIHILRPDLLGEMCGAGGARERAGRAS